jgi:hypothetical protein
MGQRRLLEKGGGVLCCGAERAVTAGSGAYRVTARVRLSALEAPGSRLALLPKSGRPAVGSGNA